MTGPPIVKVGLALLREGRLLLARNRGAELFQIPGGKVEPEDDGDIAALTREIAEELGVTLDPFTVTYLDRFVAPAAGKPGRMVETRLYQGQIDGDPTPCAEIETLAWLDLDTTDALPVTETVGVHIVPYLKARRLRSEG